MFASLYFDKADRDLLRMVNHALDKGVDDENKTFNANLHPHGILELATTHEFRVAHAVINLLSNLSAGQSEDRLQALRTLHDEVLHSAQTPFRYNTGRVLIQMMKAIVRSRHDEYAQLRLMHDFRRAAAGNPRIVRRFLAHYRLLEMPEEWNQLTMDHHVHDANTKGRKNPTHLIMDAWVKGIRFLTVIYYNYVDAQVARELMQAAEIVGISVRIGLEFAAEFRGRYVNFVWAPRGFSDIEAVLTFLGDDATRALMDDGRKASKWVETQVLAALDRWNAQLCPQLAKELGVDLPLISRQEFLTYVYTGQASVMHLAELIHRRCMPVFTRVADEWHKESKNPDVSAERRDLMESRVARMDSLNPELILATWLTAEKHPELALLQKPRKDDADRPSIMNQPVPVLLDWLASLRSGFRITLQLADLRTEDVLELLWDSQGRITHLELFNLKEWQEGRLKHLEAINELQRAVNEGSALHLKQTIRSMIRRMESLGAPESLERCAKFQLILRNIPTLQAPYKIAPLGSRIGTDSTSNSNIRHGMGLAVVQTLPPSARRALARKGTDYKPMSLPVNLTLLHRVTWGNTARPTTFWENFVLHLRRLPGCAMLGMARRREWLSNVATIQKGETNVITMGGAVGTSGNGLRNKPNESSQKEKHRPGLAYLNTPLSNMLKVLIGFLPAMLVFMQTQEWWVLAWLGAPIWFAITGLRNIAQAVLGGGGLRQTSLLRWNNYVNWSRISESLMFTGISVVLLEFGVRSLLLENVLGLTVANHYIIVFTIIATANGLYISSHNIFRGFPKEAVIGNLFRSVLAIPVSMLYFDLLIQGLEFFGTVNPDDLLQPGAAIISKAASDTIAGLIEGFADRRNNRRLRTWDYHTKLAHVFACYTRMDLAFPDRNMLVQLSKTSDLITLLTPEHKAMLQALIINALDLMYFWSYQPYAQQTFTSAIRAMTQEERILLARSQHILAEVRGVSLLFVDGLVGVNFARALSFYLNRHADYIAQINKICSSIRNSKGHARGKRQV